MKRLVSAYYDEFYPFDTFGVFESYHATMLPNDLRDNDVLVVWGGSDISPSLYNKPPSPKSQGEWPNPSRRDMIEWALMHRAKQLGIPIIGVCRGAQMLCAFAGGYLMQHITGHAGRPHHVVTHDGKSLIVNSLHHQMMVPGEAPHKVLAQVDPEHLISTEYWDGPTNVAHTQEPELVQFTEVNGLAIQWHPEMMQDNVQSTRYLRDLMGDKFDFTQ